MLRRFLALALSLAPALPAQASEPDFAAVADDVAFVTDVCFRLTTGELRWAPRNHAEEMKLVEAAGLVPGVPAGVLDTLGPVGQAAVNRATMASRSRDGFHVIMALHGSIPGCRVMLAGEPRSDTAEHLARSFAADGWTPIEAFNSKTGDYESRLFVRYGDDGLYRLDLNVRADEKSRLQVLVGLERPPARR
jgi:hypothetical protein